jgi:hypothetical protein
MTGQGALRIRLSPALAEMLPALVIAASLAVVVALLLIRLFPPAAAAPGVVTFDVIKYMNAQRRVASVFLSGDAASKAEAGTLLLGVSRRTRQVIEQVAGPGTLVLVKQGVVAGHGRDITDEVLTRLGLPTDVPTQDAAGAMLDEAPTLLLMPKPATPGPASAPATPQQPAKPSVLP